MERLEKLISYLAPDLDLPQTQEEQEQLLDLFGRYGQALTEILGGETND